MHLIEHTLKQKAVVLIMTSFLSALPVTVLAQYAPPPPLLAPSQLDNVVAPIALYPDPLLAQVLTASTYPNQIPDAAAWAVESWKDWARSVRLEPLAFYWGLLTWPVRRHGPAGLRHAALIAMAQVANAAGFFREAARERQAPQVTSRRALR